MPGTIRASRAACRSSSADGAGAHRAGEKPIGWKVGLGAPARDGAARIKMPLVGFMMEKSLGAERRHRLVRGLDQAGRRAGNRRAHGQRICPPAPIAATAIAAIAGARPGDRACRPRPPPDDVEVALAGNIFHRTSSSARPTRRARAQSSTASPGSCSAAARRSHGRRICKQNIGNIVDIVAHVAGTLAAYGEAARRRRHHHRLDRPAADDRAGRDRVRLSLEPMGRLSVRFSR